MTIVTVFLAVVAAIVGWWLSRQRLASLPWLEVGVRAEFPRTQAVGLPPAKIGLGVFLAVACCLFALLSSAYVMRTDGVPDSLSGAGLLPPPLLWVNSAMLGVSSIALQWASVSARRGQRDLMLGNLAAGGVAALGFVAGQLLAWRLLTQGGHPLGSTPANDFFYLLTGAHALHVLGGLVVLGATFAKGLRAAAPTSVRLSLELCATYWHFLLLVWLLLFGLLMGGADTIGSFCRALVS